MKGSIYILVTDWCFNFDSVFSVKHWGVLPAFIRTAPHILYFLFTFLWAYNIIDQRNTPSYGQLRELANRLFADWLCWLVRLVRSTPNTNTKDRYNRLRVLVVAKPNLKLKAKPNWRIRLVCSKINLNKKIRSKIFFYSRNKQYRGFKILYFPNHRDLRFYLSLYSCSEISKFYMQFRKQPFYCPKERNLGIWGTECDKKICDIYRQINRKMFNVLLILSQTL